MERVENAIRKEERQLKKTADISMRGVFVAQISRHTLRKLLSEKFGCSVQKNIAMEISISLD